MAHPHHQGGAAPGSSPARLLINGIVARVHVNSGFGRRRLSEVSDLSNTDNGAGHVQQGRVVVVVVVVVVVL